MTLKIGDRVRVISARSNRQGAVGAIHSVMFVVDFGGQMSSLCRADELEKEPAPMTAAAPAPLRIEAGKWHKTRGGQKAFVYAIGRRGSHPVHGYIVYPGDDIDEICNWRDDGRSTEEEQTHRDLIAEWREPKRHARWFNLQPHHGYETREDADRVDELSGIKRKACKLIEWTEGEGL